jgi:L-malate glycosyltransferase
VTPLHVAHVLGTAEVGGTEHQLLSLLDTLDARRYRSSVVLIRGGPLAGEFASRAPTRLLGKRGPADPRFLGRLVRALRALRPDVAHAWGSTPSLWTPATSRLVGVPHVVIGVRSVPPALDPARRAAERAGFLLADRVVGNSRAVVEAARARGATAGKLRLIHSAVPGGAPTPRDREPFLLALVGRIDPVKGQDVAVAALPAVLERFPEVRVDIAGGAVLREEREFERSLRAQIRAARLEGSVRLLGPVPSSAPLLARAGLALVPSRTEGLPTLVLEAMAAATPVVAAAVGGTPEVVEDGVTGWLVPPEDPGRLAAAITEALAAPEEARRRAEVARVRAARFHPVRVAAEWGALYDELATPPPGA